jgi:TetR/AcrR family transcriptional repressor of nem operon
LSRCDQQTRAVASDGIQKLVEVMAERYGSLPPAAARRRALVAVATMIGAVTAARIVLDPRLSAEILTEARKCIDDS